MIESGECRVALDWIVLKAFQRRGTVALRTEQQGASQAKIFLEKQHHSKGNNKARGVKWARVWLGQVTGHEEYISIALNNTKTCGLLFIG